MTGTASTPKSDVAQAIASVYRTEWGRIIVTLIRLVGDFDREHVTFAALTLNPSPKGRGTSDPDPLLPEGEGVGG